MPPIRRGWWITHYTSTSKIKETEVTANSYQHCNPKSLHSTETWSKSSPHFTLPTTMVMLVCAQVPTCVDNDMPSLQINALRSCLILLAPFSFFFFSLWGPRTGQYCWQCLFIILLSPKVRILLLLPPLSASSSSTICSTSSSSTTCSRIGLLFHYLPPSCW